MIGANATWYWQVAFVVAGHVTALMLAHDRALAIYEDAKRGGALAVLDARGHGRLHEPRALAAVAVEPVTRRHANISAVIVFAHAGHWLTSVAYFLPVVGFLVLARGRADPRAQGTQPVRRMGLVAVAAAVALLALVPSAPAAGTRDVLVVSNNWAGTADLVDPHSASSGSKRINVIPDETQRVAEIKADPSAAGYFTVIRDAHRRGPQPVRGRRVHVARRALRLLLAAELRRRGRDQPEDGQDPLAHQGGR